MPELTVYCASCHAVIKREPVPFGSKTQTYGMCEKCKEALPKAPAKPPEKPSMSKDKIV